MKGVRLRDSLALLREVDTYLPIIGLVPLVVGLTLEHNVIGMQARGLLLGIDFRLVPGILSIRPSRLLLDVDVHRGEARLLIDSGQILHGVVVAGLSRAADGVYAARLDRHFLRH